jgi:hypothetical protein
MVPRIQLKTNPNTGESMVKEQYTQDLDQERTFAPASVLIPPDPHRRLLFSIKALQQLATL